MIGRALKEGELEEMMSKGLLDPKKLFPLVGKYFSQFARQGGALEKKLKQLAAVEARMTESWTQFIRGLYDSGIESSLSNLYKGMDRILYSIRNLAGNALGKYLKGVLDMLSESALFVLDVFQLVFYYIDKAFGGDSNLKSFSAEMAGMATGAVLVFLTLNKIIGILKTLNVLGRIFRNLLVESAAADIAGGLEKQKGAVSGVGSILGKALGVAMAAAAGYALGNWLRDNVPAVKQFGDWLGESLGKAIYGPLPEEQVAVTNRNNSLKSMMQSGFTTPLFYQNAMNTSPQQVEVKVKMDATDGFKQVAKAEVETYGAKLTQSIVPMGWTQTSN